MTPTAAPTPTVETEPPAADTISCDTMLDPTVDRDLRAQNLAPSPKPFTSLGFEPTGAAIECPWGQVDSGPGAAELYYGWSAFAPGERDAHIALVQKLGFGIEPDGDGVMLVAPPEQQGGGDPLDFRVTDDWVAFGPVGQVDDIVWTR
ncbi:hypothetical protein ACFXQA_10020 [Microbacterium sp. P07]|uniref:hypothetical protein n=1 Tax=Microbacterium sp. P07 TaxID=3366952 RepID=UPI0037469345